MTQQRGRTGWPLWASTGVSAVLEVRSDATVLGASASEFGVKSGWHWRSLWAVSVDAITSTHADRIQTGAVGRPVALWGDLVPRVVPGPCHRFWRADVARGRAGVPIRLDGIPPKLRFAACQTAARVGRESHVFE